MTVQRRPRILSVVLAALTLALAGCRVDGTTEVHADGSMRTVVVFKDDDGTPVKLKRNCDNLKNNLAILGRFAEAKIEDISAPGGPLTCKATLDRSPYDIVDFKETETTCSLPLPPPNQNLSGGEYGESEGAVVMHGRVIKTTEGAIDGNKVTFRNFEHRENGVSITSEKRTRRHSSTSDASKKILDNVPSKDRNSGLPTWAWIAIGTAVIAMGAVLAVTIGRRKKGPNLQEPINQNVKEPSFTRNGNQ